LDGERDYWSISEVLARLRDEFPDVTISKIRFLESKGLLDLERTPSGYRKFYQHDVERLKAVLLIQKETFMPLKVIRDHLGDRDSESKPSQTLMFEPAVPENLDDLENAKEFAGEELDDSVSDLSDTSTGPEQGDLRDEVEAEGVPESISRLSSAVRASVKKLHSTGSRQPNLGSNAILDPAIQTATRDLSGDLSYSEDNSATAPGSLGSVKRSVPAGAVNPTSATLVGDKKVAERRTRQPEVQKRSNSSQPASSHHIEPVPAEQNADGRVDFTVEEITKLTGARIAEIAEMVEFGLISGHSEFGETIYTSEELALIRIVLRFRSFGIEARHLRLYKTSAEREFGFLEQVVAPIFKKRNPVASEQAKQILLELRSLGGTMREAFLSKELSKYLG
jgi:DNA-binding transcriptional MerR regulator